MKSWKVLLIIGSIIFGLGLIVLIAGFIAGGSSSPEFEMNEYTAESDVTDLELHLDAGEMNVNFSYGDRVEVVYPTSSLYSYTVEETNGKLTVKHSHGFYVNFLGAFKIPTVTVKIPSNQPAVNLRLSVSAGKATVDSGAYKNLTLELSAGKIEVGEIECENLDLELSAGAATVSGVKCAEVDVDVSAGYVQLSKLVHTGKNINVDVSAGTVDLHISGAKDDYEITVDKSAGSCNVSNQTVPSIRRNKFLDIDMSAGTVSVSFAS